MTPVAIGDIQRTQGTLKTVYNAKKPLEALVLCLHLLMLRMSVYLLFVCIINRWRQGEQLNVILVLMYMN